MRNFKWFFIGLSTFAFVIGLLIGVSNSPVVGALLTGILAIGGAFFGLISTKKKGQTEPLKVDFRGLGISLFLFSVFTVFGVAGGIGFKLLATKDSKEFVWDEKNKPPTAKQAFDWIIVNDILKKKGYSPKQIKNLYALTIDTCRKNPMYEPYRGIISSAEKQEGITDFPFIPVAEQVRPRDFVTPAYN